MKRNLIIGIGIILVIATVIFYFYKTEDSFFKETSLYPAIPVSVPGFVELNSLKSIPFNSIVLERWSDVESIAGFNKWMLQLDSIVKESSDIQNGLRSDRFVIALGLMGDNELTPLLIQKAESSGRKQSIEKLARILFPEPEFNYTEINYAGYKIISGTTADNKKSINYCFASGLLIASSNLVLVQQSLLQLTEPGITSNSSFNKLTKTFKSEPDMAWYINQRLFPDFLLEYINSNSITVINEFGENVKRNHYRNVRDFKRFASWSELDVQFNDNDILLKGLTVASDSTNDFLSVFSGQESQHSKAGDILPKNTSFYASYSVSNKELFFEKIESYFSHAGAFYKREDLIRKIETNLRVDFKKSFQSMVKSKMIVAVADVPKETAKKTTYFIFDVNEKSKAESLIDSMLTNYAKRQSLSLKDFKSTFSLNDKKEFSITKFPFPSFPGIWLGKPFYTVQAHFAVLYEDYLVFSNSEEGLKEYLLNMEEGKLLKEDNIFKRTRSLSDSKSNISTYINVGHGLNLSGELLSVKLEKELSKKKEILQKVQAVSWQVSAGEEVFSTEFNLIFDDGKKKEEELVENLVSHGMSSNSGGIQVIWQCNIGNPLITKPEILINHLDKTIKEIIVQDKSNKLYQVSSDGKINWRFDVEEVIMSEVYQVDQMANGKLQYLFNTKRKLYLIDRNGKNIDGFPISFPSEATAGVSVFDYDNNRQYRYFVPCEDNKIVAYNKNGKIIPGWIFEGTKSTVSAPVQHFRIKGKDYIVFKDKDRIYIQNRKGETIAKTQVEFENSRNPLILSPGKNPKIVATDDKGTIYKIDFDGTYQEIKVNKFDDEHFFIADDLNGNNTIEFIFIDGKELTIFDESGAVLFTKKFGNKIQHQPNIFRFGPGKKEIGIVDSKANQIYLFDVNGQSHQGFPMQGNTEFSIGKVAQGSKNLSLIVGSKGGSLITYKMD